MGSNAVRALGGTILVLATIGQAVAQPQPQRPAVPVAANMVSTGYILGPNDEIEVTVFGQKDMGVRARIGADGTVNVPFLGAVPAAGGTPADFARRLSDRYVAGGYLTNPSINVEVTNYVSRAATVLGNVPNAGNYPLDRPYTVAMMVARAGGVRADGANVVMLTPAGGGAAQRIELGDPAGLAAQVVRPGDTLFIPPAEMVYVYGQVNQPGAFPYQANMTYRQALARAGGPTLAGSTRRIEVRRGGEKVEGVNLDDAVRAEDVLVIKEKLF